MTLWRSRGHCSGQHRSPQETSMADQFSLIGLLKIQLNGKHVLKWYCINICAISYYLEKSSNIFDNVSCCCIECSPELKVIPIRSQPYSQRYLFISYRSLLECSGALILVGFLMLRPDVEGFMSYIIRGTYPCMRWEHIRWKSHCITIP